jgi:hypothetical protein
MPRSASYFPKTKGFEMSDFPENFDADFLATTYELVKSGRSIYGEIGSPKQVEKMAELEARMGLARQLGEVPPPPEPWTVERAAKERLAREYPGGDPATSPMPDLTAEWIAGQFDALGKLSVGDQAKLAREVALDVGENTSDATMNYSFYRHGQPTPTGPGIVDQLVKEAEPAITHLIEPAKRAEAMKLVRCNRRLLEIYALRGRGMTAYAGRKAAFGLK